LATLAAINMITLVGAALSAAPTVVLCAASLGFLSW